MSAQHDTPIYHELVDFIARSDPQRILAFRLSAKTSQRVEALIDREKNSRLTPREKEELDTYMQLSRIIMLAQARAHNILHDAPTTENT